MAYVSLYRKYRPQTFHDVIGQAHVTTTIQNAISSQTVTSGYLFSGTRGTAKTTCARILAKALNCVGYDGTLSVPNPTPCCVCGPCISIANSSFVDVIEMDAASHGKIDDVREIVGSIMYPPMEGRYKVYIIDEAHQLSRDAMDAFLKTLEEPPDRVVFILATTEVDRLPITIASRCQVFEFRRGSVPQISSRLSHVVSLEDASVDEAVILAIAKAAEGSYRDSLSILEQVLAYKRHNVTINDLSVVLGTVNETSLSDIIAILAGRDASKAFEFAGEIMSQGKDVRQFFRSLNSRLRDILYARADTSRNEALTGTNGVAAEIRLFTPSELVRMMGAVTQAEVETRLSNQHQLLLELTLLQLIESLSIPSVTDMRLVSSPQRGSGNSDVPAPAGTSDTSVAHEHVPKLLSVDASSVPHKAGLVQPAPTNETRQEIRLDEIDSINTDDGLLRVQTVSPESNTDTNQPVLNALPDDAPEILVKLKKSWQAVVNRMAIRSTSGVPFVRDAVPIRLQGNAFVLKLSNAFFVERMQANERGRKLVEDIINKTLDVPEGTYSVKCVLHDQVDEATRAHVRPRDTLELQSAVQPELETNAPDADDHLLDQVIAVFGGKVLDED